LFEPAAVALEEMTQSRPAQASPKARTLLEANDGAGIVPGFLGGDASPARSMPCFSETRFESVRRRSRRTAKHGCRRPRDVRSDPRFIEASDLMRIERERWTHHLRIRA
jgi:hypothetical protein